MRIVHDLSIVSIALALVFAAGGCDPEAIELEEQDFSVERAGTGHSPDFCTRWQGETIHLYPVGFSTAIRAAEETDNGNNVELVVHDEQFNNPTAENDWLLAYDWTVSCEYKGNRLDVRLQNDSSKEWMIVDSESRIGSTSNKNSDYTRFTMTPLGAPGNQVYTLTGWSRTRPGQWDPVSAYPIQGPLRRGELHARTAGCGTAIAIAKAPPATSME